MIPCSTGGVEVPKKNIEGTKTPPDAKATDGVSCFYAALAEEVQRYPEEVECPVQFGEAAPDRGRMS